MKGVFISILCITATYAKEAAEEFTEANNHFSSSVYKEVSRSENGNFLVSPFSAETILALIHSGSKGQTAAELRTALHLPDNVKRIEDGVKDLLPNLKGSEDYTLHTANKMYVKNNFDVKSGFKKAATEVFYADTESIDFTRNVTAAQVMNSWVEKQTENKIKNLIDSNLLDDGTRMVLISSLYFKANWSKPFHLAYTNKGDFHKTFSNVVKADFMQNDYEQKFLYFDSHHLNAKFLELPFKGGDASMTIILPNERNNLQAIEGRMEAVLVRQNVTSQRVEVALPKFKIESKVDLKGILKKLGVDAIFDDKKGDLSGVAGEPGDLIVSEVVQKNFIDVSEEGAEAAAATFANMTYPMEGFVDGTPEFIANQPFIFYIRVKGVIIFVGRVTDPSRCSIWIEHLCMQF